ncbi:hypothetical protein HXX76_012644 [Chlamydomonas incerta]|uniref:BTB domain-containing protein n=1 Tax=Chlamydomonas incerta TaxID=51695 RepID=A0A835SHJ9_CHLIN|nr:hypothetical protein HXX76_012644 [Chlamydomonas incerta]|eukprot:KAG2427134.1 hypothetical protein HXX76_012644 [Chlamydomonas incerta]
MYLIYITDGKAAPPPVKFTFVVKNWKDPKNDIVRESRQDSVFDAKTNSWGFTQLVSRDRVLSKDAGFLRRDGSVLLRMELAMPGGYRENEDEEEDEEGGYPAVLEESGGGRSSIGSDFLSLYDSPGSTSDLTIIATAVGHEAVVKEEGAAKKGKKRKTCTASNSGGGGGGGGCSHRFPVHRAVLAARCPYFATHFASGMGDSNARELRMPDTDPDALAALLRFVYGGELCVASREHARSCLGLADRLLLPKAVALVSEHLLTTLSAATVMADLMWAAELAEGPGQVELLTALVDYAAEQESDISEEQAEQLAAAHPALMAQLFTARVRAAKRCRTWKV